ncbi:hypothetical protein FSARC_6214 [Fusarium sarcochroum]|uniref:Uncharacterized protein n=1 Tax=Fusarium sarcochroum TaxID=1208366 RepID=A0A8H4TXQ6_9HYPO|nr:hypothetical protein FSARC_6214 [Fusarium sarcochroum]
MTSPDGSQVPGKRSTRNPKDDSHRAHRTRSGAKGPKKANKRASIDEPVVEDPKLFQYAAKAVNEVNTLRQQQIDWDATQPLHSNHSDAMAHLRRVIMTIPEQTRKVIMSQINLFLLAAAARQVPLRCIWGDSETMGLRWVGDSVHFEILLQQGTLNWSKPTLEPPAKKLRAQGSETTGTGNAYPPTARMDPTMAANIHQMLKDMEHKSHVWQELESLFGIEPPTFREARNCLRQVAKGLIFPMNKILAPEGNRNFSGDFDGVICLMLLAAGVVKLYRIDEINYSNNWKMVPEAFEKAMPGALKDLQAIYHNRELDAEHIGPMLAPAVTALANAPIITEQRALYKDIRALLYGGS